MTDTCRPTPSTSGGCAPITVSPRSTWCRADCSADGQFRGHLRHAGRFRGGNLCSRRPTDGTWTFNSYRGDLSLRALPEGHVGCSASRQRESPRRADPPRGERKLSREDRISAWSLSSTSSSSAGWADRCRCSSRADALAAPQGRAEDIFAGIVVDAGKQWSIKAGYRFLEGGADNDEVYTFAAVHYVAGGVVSASSSAAGSAADRREPSCLERGIQRRKLRRLQRRPPRHHNVSGAERPGNGSEVVAVGATSASASRSSARRAAN